MGKRFCAMFFGVIPSFWKLRSPVQVWFSASHRQWQHFIWSFQNIWGSVWTLESHLMSSVLKLTMVLIKLSFIMMPRIIFQSVVFSPSNRQIDSRAILTAPGGLAIDRISTKCCLRIPLTAVQGKRTQNVQNGKRYVFIQRSIQSVGPLKALYTSPPGRPVHSDTNSASPGSILATQQVRTSKTNQSHFQHCLSPGTHFFNDIFFIVPHP